MFLRSFVPFRWICRLEIRILGKSFYALKSTVMTKIDDVIMICFISAAFFVQFPLCGYQLSSIVY